MNMVREYIPVEVPVAQLVSAAAADVEVMVPQGVTMTRVLCCPTRILQLTGQARDAAVEFSGVVEMGVLYVDEEGAPDVVTAQSPFRHSVAAAAVKPGMTVEARCSATPATAAVRSGMIHINTVVELEADVTDSEQLDCVTALQDGGVEVRTAPVSWSRPLGCVTHAQTLREDLELPAGLLDIDKVLWPIARATVDHVMVQGEEAMASGALKISVLYRTADEGLPLQTAEFEVPYTATLPAQELTEQASVVAWVRPGDLRLRACEDVEGNPRILSVETPLQFMIAGWDEGSLVMLEDAYGLMSDIKLDVQSQSRCGALREYKLRTNATGHWAARSALPLGLRILQSAAEPVLDEARAEDGRLVLTGRLFTRVFYINGESGELACEQGEAPFTTEADLPAGVPGDVSLAVELESGQAAVSRSGDGFAVQTSLSARVLARDSSQIQWVADAQEGEVVDMNKLPPLVLMVAGNNDTLWSMARSCHVPMKSLVQTNPDLSDRAVRPGDRVIVVR